MKLTGCILAVVISVTVAYHHPNVVDYSLQTINHLAASHFGPFQCIFYDISAEGAFDDILDGLVKSPKVQQIVRFVVRGPVRSEHQYLPQDPSLILMSPGSDEVMSDQQSRALIIRVLGNFNPAAKLLVFVDFDTYNEYLTQVLVVWANFNNAVFVDNRSGKLRYSSLKHYVAAEIRPHPKDLYEWHKQELRGGIITFVPGCDFSRGAPMMWLEATVDFLNAKLVKYRGPNPKKANFSLHTYLRWSPRASKRFDNFFVTEIMKYRILVPKGRPVNAVELMLMPFDWQVWMLLLILLILVEAIKRFVPDLFRNDPVLLVVCGFERHNLHQAGRWEKIILHSLIILMFFVTNAFESKIVSMMVDKPTIQPIKSLNDFDKHGIKIVMDLSDNPGYANHSIVGKYLVDGLRQIWETIPGVAMFISQDVAELAPRIAFNFERGEPWFDLLDQVFLTDIQYYLLAFRSPLLKVFKFTRLAFIEAGLYELHKWRFHMEEYYIIWGRRPRKVKESDIYLKFNDMLSAWIVLGIGFGVSLVGFLGELSWIKFGKLFGKTRTRLGTGILSKVLRGRIW